MAKRDLVVIGASAGGVEALRELVQALPRDLPAALVVVMHLSPSNPSVLPSILSRARTLPAVAATEGARLERGRIHVAPPDHHVLVHDGGLHLTRGPRENGHRPAVDPLFRSASRWWGPRVVAVVLSGSLDDGTSGAFAVKARGGRVLAQTPESALYDGMPRSVIERVGADVVGSPAELAAELARLVREEVPDMRPERPPVGDAYVEDQDMGQETDRAPEGLASAFTCPECHGALWELKDGELVRYRCRVGHAYGPDSLAAAQADHVEEALWAAYRALEEAESLSTRLAGRARQQGFEQVAVRYEDEGRAAGRRAAVIRGVLQTGNLAATGSDNGE